MSVMQYHVIQAKLGPGVLVACVSGSACGFKVGTCLCLFLFLIEELGLVLCLKDLFSFHLCVLLTCLEAISICVC